MVGEDILCDWRVSEDILLLSEDILLLSEDILLCHVTEIVAGRLRSEDQNDKLKEKL